MGKYFKYALGEVILVMIGILLALQVNNWNEARKDRIKEKAILEQLHKEFQKNLSEFSSVKINQTRTHNSGKIVFRNIDKLHIPIHRDSVYRYATRMFGGYTYYPSGGVIESLISSGDFKLIQNDTLRNYLVSWKDVLKRYSHNVTVDLNLWANRIEPYIMTHGDFLNTGSPKNIRLLNDPVFINMMFRKQFFQNNIMSSINGNNGLEHYMKEILRLSKTTSDD
jgi:hypothetical protein